MPNNLYNWCLKLAKHAKSRFIICVVSRLMLLGLLLLLTLPMSAAELEITTKESPTLSSEEKAQQSRLIAEAHPANSEVANISLPGLTLKGMPFDFLLRAHEATPAVDEITVGLGFGREVRVQRVDSVKGALDTLSWWGNVQGNRGSAILVMQPSTESNLMVTGTLDVDGVRFEIQPLGANKVLIMSGGEYPPEHGPVGPPHAKPFRGSSQNKKAMHAAPSTQPALIKVLFAYTPAVAKYTNVLSLAEFAITSANISFKGEELQLSQGAVPRIAAEVTNVAMVAVSNYVESAGIAADLARFQDPNDGFMDEIHKQRDRARADICVLLVAPTPNNPAYNLCGLASTIYATPSTAFCVVNARCVVGNLSVAHEIGHLMGARHNVEIDDNTVPFADSHGVYWTNKWRSIMAYLGTSDDTTESRII